MNDILLTAVSLIVGAAVSLMISRAYYRRGGFSYFIKDAQVFDKASFNRDDRISLTADGKPIDGLRQVIIAFWNSGTVSYSRNAIAPSDTLRLVLPTSGFKQVLGFKQSRRAVGASFTEDSDCIHVSFDLLDEEDWVAAYVLYELGDRDDVQRPELVGALMNLPKGFRFVDLEEHATEKHWSKRVLAFLVATMPVFFGVTTYKLLAIRREIESMAGESIPGGTVVLWVSGATAVFLGLLAILYLVSRWRVTLERVPKQLLNALPMYWTKWFQKS